MPKIPPCACGSTTFALVGSDGMMVHYAVERQSCGKKFVLAVRRGKVKVIPNIDDIQR